jgi:hypothetical protein
MSKTTEELDITPLLVIEHVHRDRHRTSNLLKALFSNFESIFPSLSRDNQFLYRSYIERFIIQNTCQYIEDVGSYSVACKETGLLYAERVVSVESSEIAEFYNRVHKLTDDEIRKIFNIRSGTINSSSEDYTQIRKKYNKLKEFRNKYQSLYNAMKHGNRVFCHEISKKDILMDSLHGTSLDFAWIHVEIHEPPVPEKVKDWDGSEIEIDIRNRKLRGLILPSDDISEFVNVAEDCYQIIEQILRNNSP